MQRPLLDQCSTLIGREFTRTRPDWSREVREVPPEELQSLLDAEFGITLTTAEAEALVAFHKH